MNAVRQTEVTYIDRDRRKPVQPFQPLCLWLLHGMRGKSVEKKKRRIFKVIDAQRQVEYEIKKTIWNVSAWRPGPEWQLSESMHMMFVNHFALRPGVTLTTDQVFWQKHQVIDASSFGHETTQGRQYPHYMLRITGLEEPIMFKVCYQREKKTGLQFWWNGFALDFSRDGVFFRLWSSKIYVR